jgi:valyl-tRNA synthetase
MIRALIYRGVRMVNWDPRALTAVSDEEVIYKEVRSKFYYLRYQIQGEPGRIRYHRHDPAGDHPGRYGHLHPPGR